MKLFEPVTIRGMELKNRIIMPAIHLNLGVLSKRAMAFYEERAKGGAGAIVTAAITPAPFFDDDVWEGRGTAASFVKKLRENIVARVHAGGAKIGAQLWYGNMFPAGMWGGYGAGKDVISGDRVAPSAREGMRSLTEDEIQAIIKELSLAAIKVREAGFDFIEYNFAHGYLPNQFFSPLYNRRKDIYGGDLRGRMRFGIDCIRSARQSVGDDYPISVRLGAHEYRQPNGITIDESVEFAVELEKAGVDIIAVSVADPFPHICPKKDEPPGTYVPLAEAIKSRVGTYVMGVGKINSGEVAEEILSRGKVELIGVGRQLIADPHWPLKVLNKEEDKIVACINCNNCVKPVMEGTELKCSVNPEAGKEWEYER